MECNKDEASRAKEIAERKFTEKDVTGAKKFALKAHNLYPGLEGLSQMLATLNVHLSAENKICGEVDWYGILGVNPLADDETVKKQYRKLALMLHPDKNKSVGADGAFKLISEAWSLLSDKTKRMAYDQKRCPKTSMSKVPTASGGQSVQPFPNGFHNFRNNVHPNVGMKSASGMGPQMPPAPASVRTSNPTTFWTACNLCKMQYEYQRFYLNHKLRCPNCQKSFVALEASAVPSNGSKPSPPFSQNYQNLNHHTAHKNVGVTGFTGSFHQANFQWGSFSRTAGVGNPAASASASNAAAQGANVVQQAYDKVMRERQESHAAMKRREAAIRKKTYASKRVSSSSPFGFSNAGSIPDLGGDRPPKKRNIDDASRSTNYGANISDPKATGNVGYGLGSAAWVKPSGFDKSNSTRDLPLFELRNMLAEKAKREIRKKLSEWSSAVACKAANKEKEREKETEKKKQKGVAVNGDRVDQKKLFTSVDTKKESQDKKTSLDTSGVNMESEAIEPVNISVPDPDFYEFDKDRTERSFAENQIWAAYDDDDGMPRYYAIIQNVISLKPFKLSISWLNSKSNSELGPVNWVGSGFPKTCGDFRAGKHEDNSSLNSFSHKVLWTKGARGVVHIFPRKGDVWALYRNWSPDWNELTADEVVHKYDMVEVLDEYNEEQGVSVRPLVKVAGFKTVFYQHMDPKQVKRIPREEMFRFSHQVPFYLLTGSEAPNAPKGCRELDPAATPLELLQIITEAEEKVMRETVEQTVTDAKKTEEVQNSAEQVLGVREAVDNDVQMKTVAKDSESIESSEKQIRRGRVLDNSKKTYTRRT